MSMDNYVFCLGKSKCKPFKKYIIYLPILYTSNPAKMPDLLHVLPVSCRRRRHDVPASSIYPVSLHLSRHNVPPSSPIRPVTTFPRRPSLVPSQRSLVVPHSSRHNVPSSSLTRPVTTFPRRPSLVPSQRSLVVPHSSRHNVPSSSLTRPVTTFPRRPSFVPSQRSLVVPHSSRHNVPSSSLTRPVTTFPRRPSFVTSRRRPVSGRLHNRLPSVLSPCRLVPASPGACLTTCPRARSCAMRSMIVVSDNGQSALLAWSDIVTNQPIPIAVRRSLSDQLMTRARQACTDAWARLPKLHLLLQGFRVILLRISASIGD